MSTPKTYLVVLPDGRRYYAVLNEAGVVDVIYDAPSDAQESVHDAVAFGFSSIADFSEVMRPSRQTQARQQQGLARHWSRVGKYLRQAAKELAMDG